MRNLRILLPLADGSQFPMEFDSGRELIQGLIGDDWGPPPRCLQIEATSVDGTTVVISVPYNESDEAHVTVEKRSP